MARFPGTSPAARPGWALRCDELYRHLTERMHTVRITTADHLVDIVTTWGYLAVTRPGWIRLELSLAGSNAPTGSVPLARVIAALVGCSSAPRRASACRAPMAKKPPTS